MTTPTPPFPESLWSTASPELQAAILALVQAYQERIDQLEAQVADMQARLQLNSTNSSKPPSSDPIGLKRKPPAPPSGRKRGGQAGHHRVRRAWSHRRRCAPLPIAGPRIAAAVAMPWSVMTRPPWSTKSPNCPRSSRWSTNTGFIAWPAPNAA